MPPSGLSVRKFIATPAMPLNVPDEANPVGQGPGSQAAEKNTPPTPLKTSPWRCPARRRDESRRSRLRVRATGRLHDLWWAQQAHGNSVEDADPNHCFPATGVPASPLADARGYNSASS